MAIKLIEEQGVESLTMRDVASRLGAATSALYRHVADKEALLLLAADQILAQIVVPERGDWYERLSSLVLSIRTTLGRYPGVSQYIFRRNPLTVNSRQHRDALMEIFTDAGLDGAAAEDALFAVYLLLAGDLTVGPRLDVSGRREEGRFTVALEALLRGLGLKLP